MLKMKCSVENCHNKKRFTFPKEKKIREKWLLAIRKPDFVPSHNHGLCMDHFLPEQILTESREGGFKLIRARLLKEAVPCIFPWQKSHKPLPKSIMDEVNKTNNINKHSSLIKEEFIYTSEAIYINDRINLIEEPVSCHYNNNSNFKTPKIEDHERTMSDVVISENEKYSQNHDMNQFVNKKNLVNDTINEKIKHIFNEHKYFSSDSDNQNSQPNVSCRYSIEHFKNDPKGVYFFTGLESYEKFMTVFKTLGKKVYQITYSFDQSSPKEISAENKLFLTLWKLRRNCSDYELSKHFCISEISMKVIFKKMVVFMANKWSRLDIWPSNEIINSHIPEGCEVTTPKRPSNYIHDPRILSSIIIHIENHIKLYNILSKSLPPTYVPLGTQITGVCIMLCNFKEIIKK